MNGNTSDALGDPSGLDTAQSDAFPPEHVNLDEAPFSGIYWVAASVSSGLLIHATMGGFGGVGGLRTNRSGWAS